MKDFIHVDDQSKEVALNEVVAEINKRGKYVTNSATADATAAAGNMTGAGLVVLNMTGALGAGKALTTRTVAQLLGDLTSYKVGETWRLRIINSSSGNFAWTLTAGDGVTVNGTATIAQNTWREFLVTIASATSITMQSIGTGTNS